jgi:hypothetical protein
MELEETQQKCERYNQRLGQSEGELAAKVKELAAQKEAFDKMRQDLESSREECGKIQVKTAVLHLTTFSTLDPPPTPPLPTHTHTHLVFLISESKISIQLMEFLLSLMAYPPRRNNCRRPKVEGLSPMIRSTFFTGRCASYIRLRSYFMFKSTSELSSLVYI